MPNGGPKDETPPQLRSAQPANQSCNYTGRDFYIEFDEYVVLKDADNNVLVSPPLKNKPTYRTKGRGVQVRIADTLQPNTTYLFQFKNAIAARQPIAQRACAGRADPAAQQGDRHRAAD